MTKFILVGGYPGNAPDGGKAFCEEVVEGFDQPVRILECLFARPQEAWEEAFQKDKYFFATQLPALKMLFTLAQPEIFSEQIRSADVIYLRGGAREREFIEFLRQQPLVLSELQGKTLVGSSAGADALGEYFYGLDTLKIEEGLGLLSVKVMVHYRSDYNAPNIDWEKAEKELTEYREVLPLITLAEGEYQVIEK